MLEADLWIRQARLIDGTGAPAEVGDLAVRGDRILAMGPQLRVSAREVVDADGLALAPGFIDSHGHDDRAVLDWPSLDAKVSQGVTTVINGNCGISIAPVLPGRASPPPPLNLFTEQGPHFASFSDYFAALEAKPAAVNTACLCGHSNLRHATMAQLDRAATGHEIDAMCALLTQALREGALGLSSGTYYAPASAAPVAELIAIARTLNAHGGLYVTHMRNEEDAVLDALEETLQIGREAQVPVVVSHHKCMSQANHGKSKISLQRIDEARRSQLVGLDVYPYVASSTILQPQRVGKCARVLITWSEAMPSAAGRDLADVAAELGCSPEEAAQRLLPGGAVYFQMDEQDVRRILAYPHTMVGSDGIVHEPHPHPRAWGTFPRVLGHYARDQGLFSLETAVRKMTGLTAQTFGLKDRGLLRPGHCADLVLFDPERIQDLADFSRPCQPARGLERVYANGRCTWWQGQSTGQTPGRPLRRGEFERA
jgi:N-acyl-D-amino-acid deacylase